jgi:hypothetical protein
MNTSTPSTQPPLQRQETETKEAQQQDSEEEIEAIIKDELACLRQVLTMNNLCSKIHPTSQDKIASSESVLWLATYN